MTLHCDVRECKERWADRKFFYSCTHTWGCFDFFECTFFGITTGRRVFLVDSCFFIIHYFHDITLHQVELNLALFLILAALDMPSNSDFLTCVSPLYIVLAIKYNHITSYHSFPCKVCGKHFTRKSGFDRHRFVHLSAKPFNCKGCGKGYCDSSGLKKHLKASFEFTACIVKPLLNPTLPRYKDIAWDSAVLTIFHIQ